MLSPNCASRGLTAPCWRGSRERADEDLHLSAVTLGELQAGVEITRERDLEKASEIETWVDQVAQTWNILPVDARVFRVCAKLIAPAA
jgi:hypothetical protein